MIRYENTPENAVAVGWVFCPDYYLGDATAKFVIHDTQHGVFIFTDAERDCEGDDPFFSDNDTADQFRLRAHKLRLMGYLNAAAECDEDAARLEQTQREIAAEKLAWDALTPEQQAAHTAAVEAKFADIVCEDAMCDGCGLPADDPDCECSYDASDMEDEA